MIIINDLKELVFTGGVSKLYDSLCKGAVLLICTKRDKVIGYSGMTFTKTKDGFGVTASDCGLTILNSAKASKGYIITSDDEYTLEVAICDLFDMPYPALHIAFSHPKMHKKNPTVITSFKINFGY